VLLEIGFLLNGFNLVASEEISYLNADMCEFESSQRKESKAQPADSSEACSKPRAVKAVDSWLVVQINLICFQQAFATHKSEMVHDFYSRMER